MHKFLQKTVGYPIRGTRLSQGPTAQVLAPLRNTCMIHITSNWSGQRPRQMVAYVSFKRYRSVPPGHGCTIPPKERFYIPRVGPPQTQPHNRRRRCPKYGALTAGSWNIMNHWRELHGIPVQWCDGIMVMCPTHTSWTLDNLFFYINMWTGVLWIPFRETSFRIGMYNVWTQFHTRYAAWLWGDTLHTSVHQHVSWTLHQIWWTICLGRCSIQRILIVVWHSNRVSAKNKILQTLHWGGIFSCGACNELQWFIQYPPLITEDVPTGG